MNTSDKTQPTQAGSKTDNLQKDAEQRATSTVSGSIADDQVKEASLQPSSQEANADPAITSANPAISGADPKYGKTPDEPEAGLSS